MQLLVELSKGEKALSLIARAWDCCTQTLELNAFRDASRLTALRWKRRKIRCRIWNLPFHPSWPRWVTSSPSGGLCRSFVCRCHRWLWELHVVRSIVINHEGSSMSFSLLFKARTVPLRETIRDGQWEREDIPCWTAKPLSPGSGGC